MTMSPTLGQQFSKLIEVSTVLCLMIYVYSCVAIFHYDKVAAFEGASRYRGIAMIAMLFSLAVILLSGMRMLALTAMIVLATFVVYPFFIKGKDRSAPV
jgi:hypothetical protein